MKLDNKRGVYRALLLFMFVFLVAGLGTASAALTADNSGYWTFDNTLVDATGNGNTANNNGATYNVTGKINGADSYDGSSDYMQVNASGTNMGDSFSSSTWIWLDNVGSSQQIWSNYESGALRNGYFRVSSSNVLFLQDYKTGGGAVTTTDTLSAGQWYHVVVTMNSTTSAIYINGVLSEQTTGLTRGTYSNQDFEFGAVTQGGGQYFDGTIDEMSFWDRQITQSEITELYNSGAGKQYPYGAANNFIITAQDSYTGSSLFNFSAIINTTTYTTTNGTIKTDILDNSTSLYNIIISSTESGGYFNRTYNDYNVSSNLQANVHQAEISFTANNRVSGDSVTDYTATAPNSQSNTGTNPSLNVTTGELTYTFNKTSYYDSTTTANLSALETGNASFTVYDHALNVTVSASGSASESNFTIDVVSLNHIFSETLSTTDGWIRFNLTDGSYNVTLNDSNYELQTVTINLNSTTNLTNYDFVARTARAFNITFFNETTNDILDNSTINMEFISDSNSFNATTSNGTYYVDLLTPDSYTIKYSIVGSEVIRDYFTTLTPQSFQELDLYLIDEDISAYYVTVAVDSSGNACQQNTISLLRYYVTPNEYKVVEMTRTNSQGQGVLRVKPNNVDYKLLFDGSCGTFTSAPTRLIDTTNTYTITGGQTVLESVSAISGASTGLTYNNVTETFVYTWTSDSNVITQGCLEVFQRKSGVRSNFDTKCSSGNTGSVFVTINDTNQTTYFASGRLYTSTAFSDETTNNLEISFLTGFFELGNYAPFIALLAFIAIVLFVGVNAVSLVIGAVASLAILSTFALVNIGTGTLLTFIAIGIAILYRIAGRT